MDAFLKMIKDLDGPGAFSAQTYQQWQQQKAKQKPFRLIERLQRKASVLRQRRHSGAVKEK